MPTGTVKWFNAQKGFGFIQPEDGGKDVFVHITAVQAAGLQDLAENQRVTYEVVTERGKQAAANLRLAQVGACVDAVVRAHLSEPERQPRPR